jgi:hypothetical protein
MLGSARPPTVSVVRMDATYRQAISIGLKKSVNGTLTGGGRIYGYHPVNSALSARFLRLLRIARLLAANKRQG